MRLEPEKVMQNIGSMIYQNFQNFEKMRIPRKNRNFRFSRRECTEDCEMKKHSTSPPCGNLVDGLPHDCHTETIAKLARLAPAENGKLMENFLELTKFYMMFDKKIHRIRCQAYT